MNQLAKMVGSLRRYAGVFVLGALTGCSGGLPHQDQSGILVRITDLEMAVGEWEGTVRKDDDIFPEGKVQLMIRSNGTYLFIGQSSSDVALGAGFLEIRDSRLSGETDRRTVTFSLYDHSGQPVLVVEAIALKTGEHYHGKFTKVQ